MESAYSDVHHFVAFVLFFINFTVGFYEGHLYHCSNEDDCYKSSPYVDLLGVGIHGSTFSDYYSWGYQFFIMQSIGFGVYTDFVFNRGKGGPSLRRPPAVVFSIGTMIKVDNNWTPSGVE